MEGTPINDQLASDLNNLQQPDPRQVVEDFRNEVVQIGMVKEKLVQTTNHEVLNQLYGKIEQAFNKVVPLKGSVLRHGLLHSLLEALVELVHIVRELAVFEKRINQPEAPTNNVLVDMSKPKVLELRNEDKAA